jgi:hypothetical protein
MQHMLADIDEIRAYVYGSDTRDQAEAAATDLVTWSNRMSALFPPGTASTEYVDMSPARVSGAPAAMSQSSQMLLAAVQREGRATVGYQVARTEHDGCGFCHLSGTR